MNGAPLSETKMKVDLAYLALGARKSILEQSENYTVSSSAANSDIPIK